MLNHLEALQCYYRDCFRQEGSDWSLSQERQDLDYKNSLMLRGDEDIVKAGQYRSRENGISLR